MSPLLARGRIYGLSIVPKRANQCGSVAAAMSSGAVADKIQICRLYGPSETKYRTVHLELMYPVSLFLLLRKNGKNQDVRFSQTNDISRQCIVLNVQE